MKTIEQQIIEAREELKKDGFTNPHLSIITENTLPYYLKERDRIAREEGVLAHFSYEDWDIGGDDKLRVGDYINLNHQRGHDGYEQNLEGKIVLHDTNKMPVILYNIEPATEDEEESGDYGDLQSFFMDGWTFSRIKALTTPLEGKD